MALALIIPTVAGAQTSSGIVSPTDGQTLSGTVDVTAVFPGSPYVRWDLFILPGGNDSGRIWVASGEDAGEATLSLDTTKYPDGDHAFSLRLVKADSNYDEQIVPFTIDNSGAASSSSESASTASTPDIVDTAVAAGSFPTLVAAVQAADLVDALKGAGPFTVFAPTEEAFAALPEGTLDSLLADPAALANILLYHVVSGKVMAADVTDGLTAETLQGSDVTFTVADGSVKINDANIVTTDIEAGNGVIHVIDAVILPPAGSETAAAPAAAPATAPATTGLISPTDGATLSGTVDVTAVFPGSSYVRWDLFILPGGNDSGKIWVASGEDAGEATLSLDTTNLPNGDHAFSLRLVKADSNYDEQIVNFTIAN
ncbi:MAG: fasciclin domain-containing protein [Anaerolineales bacterium]|nr:fasciclin domain-containing protein [Anaerolineales bacterium]